ncbi:MAG TPA: hypothetical protein DCE39_12215 [Planctomycetaceae bacterium]|nr:hypothetical protein [Planctomycetaceae bacterium]
MPGHGLDGGFFSRDGLQRNDADKWRHAKIRGGYHSGGFGELEAPSWGSFYRTRKMGQKQFVIDPGRFSTR